MSTLLALGLANAIGAGLLAVPAFLVSRYGKRPALAHALWLVVLLKLVTPPVVRPSLAWLPAADAPPARVARVEEPKQQLRMVMLSTEAPSPAVLVAPKTPLATPPTGFAFVERPQPEPPAVVAEDRLGTVVQLLLAVWLLGAAVCLARALYYVVRFHALLRHATLAAPDIQAQARELAAQMGLRRCPPVWLVPGPLPPMVWGVGWVRILFPVGLIDRLGAEERASLLTHELAHVRRGDHWVRVLELGVVTLFWWYPLAWWARRQLHDREEECCDAVASDAVSPRVYAGAILEAVDFLSEARPRLPAMASALSGAKSLKERLTLILTTPTAGYLPRWGRFLLGGLALAVLPLMPTLVQAERPAVEPPPVTFAALPEDVCKLDFSLDGKTISAAFAGDRGRQVQGFDVVTHKTQWRAVDLQRPERSGRSLDGKWVVGGQGRVLNLLDTATGKVKYTFAGEPTEYYSVTFSADGKLFAAGGGPAQGGPSRLNHALVFDLGTKRQVARLDGHTRAVLGLAFAPRNDFIATASADHTVRIWDRQSFKLRNVLIGHKNAVKGVAFSPDSSLLATGGWDGTIALWDPRDGRRLAQMTGHPGAVRELVFSPDGKLLASGGEKRTVKVWAVAERREIATLATAAATPRVTVAVVPPAP